MGCRSHELVDLQAVETVRLREEEVQIVDPVAADRLDPILDFQNCLLNAWNGRHVGVSCSDAFGELLA